MRNPANLPLAAKRPDLKREMDPELGLLPRHLHLQQGPDTDRSKVEHLPGWPSEPNLQAGNNLAQSFLKDGNQGTYPDNKLLCLVFQSGNLIAKEEQPSTPLLQLVFQAAESPASGRSQLAELKAPPRGRKACPKLP